MLSVKEVGITAAGGTRIITPPPEAFKMDTSMEVVPEMMAAGPRNTGGSRSSFRRSITDRMGHAGISGLVKAPSSDFLKCVTNKR